MSGTEHDPINFREVDSEGRPAGYGRTPDPDALVIPSAAEES